MSLIVARSDSGRMILIGDTRITYKMREANPYLEGCLKLYIINPKLAIGFAGIVEHFESALPQLYVCKSAAELVAKALEIKRKDHLDFDLIAAEVGAESLLLLKGEDVIKSSVGFVGDSDAFNAYQRALFEPEFCQTPDANRLQFSVARLPEPIWPNEIYSRMCSAFKVAVHSSNIARVGGMLVPLCTHNEEFQYMNYMDAISDPFEVTGVLNTGGPIDFGSAMHGSFSVEFADSTPHGGSRSEVGFYFLQGGFGVIFPDNGHNLRRPQLIRGENPALWTLNSAKAYGNGGVALGFTNKENCRLAGEKLLKDQQWNDALFCYKLSANARDLKQDTAFYDRYLSGFAIAQFNCGKQIETMTMTEQALRENENLPFCRDHLTRMRDAFTSVQN